MRTADELTIKRVAPPDERDVPKSEISIEGKPTGKFVPGAFLEAAVQYDDFYLLFMTDDIPYEEALRILFLDKTLKILDSALLGGPYSTGWFSALSLEEPNTIRFRFIGDTTWSIELLSRPRFRIPFLAEPPGVHRPFGFFRHFLVRGNPRPRTD